MDDSTKALADLALRALQTGAVLLGAAWAYFRFFREGTHQPRIECDIECSFFGPQDGKYVAAFAVLAINRGHVEHKLPAIRLRVRGIRSDAPLQTWSGREPLLEFPESGFETVNIVPKKLVYYFVRPGVHQRFSFVTSVPSDWRFLIARATFKYDTANELHTAERVFEVTAANPG